MTIEIVNFEMAKEFFAGQGLVFEKSAPKLRMVDPLPPEKPKPSIQFGPGLYQCKNGKRAIVARTRQLGMTWLLDGAIHCEEHGTFEMTSWLLNGDHECDDYSLREKI